jgi:hypothetical protein
MDVLERRSAELGVALRSCLDESGGEEGGNESESAHLGTDECECDGQLGRLMEYSEEVGSIYTLGVRLTALPFVVEAGRRQTLGGEQVFYNDRLW